MTVTFTKRQIEVLENAGLCYLRTLEGLEDSDNEAAVLRRALDKFASSDAHNSQENL